jgi:hypothetical protein
MFSYSVKDLVDILEDIYTYRHLNLVLSTDCRWIKHVNSSTAEGSEVANDLGMLKCQLNISNGHSKSRKSKKDRQHNDQKKKTENDLQSITQKTKDRATRTPLKPGVNPVPTFPAGP